MWCRCGRERGVRGQTGAAVVVVATAAVATNSQAAAAAQSGRAGRQKEKEKTKRRGAHRRQAKLLFAWAQRRRPWESGAIWVARARVEWEWAKGEGAASGVETGNRPCHGAAWASTATGQRLTVSKLAEHMYHRPAVARLCRIHYLPSDGSFGCRTYVDICVEHSNYQSRKGHITTQAHGTTGCDASTLRPTPPLADTAHDSTAPAAWGRGGFGSGTADGGRFYGGFANAIDIGCVCASACASAECQAGASRCVWVGRW